MRSSVLLVLVLASLALLASAVDLRGGPDMTAAKDTVKANANSLSLFGAFKKFWAPGCASVKTRTCRGCVKAGCGFWRHTFPEALRQMYRADRVYDKCAPPTDKDMLKAVAQGKYHAAPSVTEEDCAKAAAVSAGGPGPRAIQDKRNEVSARIAARVSKLNVAKAPYKRIPCDETLMDLVLERERIDDVPLLFNPFFRIAHIMHEYLAKTRTKLGGAVTVAKDLAKANDLMAAAQVGFNAATGKLHDFVKEHFQKQIDDAYLKSELMDEARPLCVAADCVNEPTTGYVEVLDGYGKQLCTMTCTQCPKYIQISDKLKAAAKAMAPVCQNGLHLETVHVGKILFDFAREYVAATSPAASAGAAQSAAAARPVSAAKKN